MAINVKVPISLPLAAADYISAYGTATLFLEYGTATTPADGTASTALVSGTEYYTFDVSGRASTDYYRARVGETGGTSYHDYLGPAFQLPVAYASLDEFLRGLDVPDTARYDEFDDLLVQATDYITKVVCGGRSFFRDPVGSGTATKTFDIIYASQSRLSDARGKQMDIISVSSLGVGGYTGDTYDTLTNDSSGYYLAPDYPLSGHPYSDLILSDQGTAYTRWPTGYRTVQITGAFGWSTIPELVKRATVDLARKWWQERGSDGDPVGISAFGSPVFGPGTPKTVRDLAKSEYAWRQWVG